MPWDALWAVFTAAFPRRNEAPERAYRRGVTVACLLMAIGGLSVANTIAMFGLLPVLFTGFAHADTIPNLAKSSEVARLQQSLDVLTGSLKDAQIATLGQQIYNLRVMECSARKSGNAEAANSHAGKIEELKFSFRKLASYDYIPRSCAEL